MHASGKRVLVAGAAGFLGSHLCDRLVADGYFLIALDNLSSGNWSNIDQLRGTRQIEFREHDIRDRLNIVDIGADIETVVNFACPASPVDYMADPIGTTRTAVLGTLNMLEFSRALGARMVQASTSEVYGDPLHHPQREGDWGNVNPVGARACYAEGKRCAESLAADFIRQDADVRILRIFNAYGPRMRPDDGRVISTFLRQALAGDPITIHGDGTQTRSLCYVDDLVEAVVRTIEGPGRLPGPMNVGSPHEVTISEIAATILRITGSPSRVVETSARPDDPRRRRPDISLARAYLDWEPMVGLEEGLRRTLAQLDDQRVERGA